MIGKFFVQFFYDSTHPNTRNLGVAKIHTSVSQFLTHPTNQPSRQQGGCDSQPARGKYLSEGPGKLTGKLNGNVEQLNCKMEVISPFGSQNNANLKLPPLIWCTFELKQG